MANPKVTFDFKADISQINQAIQKIDQRLDKFGGKAKQQTEGFAGGMAKFGLAVSGVQQAFGILDQTIGAVVRKVTEMGGNFEHTMNKVKAVSGSTGDEFDRLRDSALAFGSSTAKSASEVGKLQFELSKLGFKTDEILAGTEGILNMAIAFDVDLPRSAEVAGGVLRQFGLDASEAGNVADIMATAFSSTALDTEKFANAMVYVGQIAPQAGFEMHEVTSLLGVLSNKMVDSSIAGTALTKIMEQMANPQSDLTKEIGHTVSGYDGFVEVMQHMKTSGKDLTDFLGFVLPRTAKTFGVLVDSANDIDKLTKSLEDVQGASKEMADIMLNDLVGANLLLDSAMEGLWIRISEELTPALLSMKQAQIEFIQDIDTEEIYAYASGFTAVAIAVAYFNRQALLAIVRINAVKVALTKSGWGLVVIGIGAIAGAVIDATDAFAEETEEVDKNTLALERNKAMTERLKNQKEEITEIQDINKLKEMRLQQAEVTEVVRHHGEVELAVMKDVLKGRKHLQGISITPPQTALSFSLSSLGSIIGLTEEQEEATLSNEEVNKRAYATANNNYEKLIARAERRIKTAENEIKINQKDADANNQYAIDYIKRQEAILVKEKEVMALNIEKKQAIMGVMNLNEFELEQSLLTTKAKIKEGNARLDLINLQIKGLEVNINKEKELTDMTVAGAQKKIDAIEKLEKKMRTVILKATLDINEKILLSDADKFARKKHALEKERIADKNAVTDFMELQKQKQDIMKIQYDAMDSGVAKDALGAEMQMIEKEYDLLGKQLITIDGFYADQKKIIDKDKADYEKDLQDEKIAKAQELGFVMIGEEQREFDAYIEFLDEKILAEEAYSEKWFDLMQHRQDKYDSHIAMQLDTGRMSTVEHMALLSQQLDQENLTAEKRLELQGQMIGASKAFLEEGGMIHKSYLKKELVDFISAQQLKLLGKLAEILAMGASTLGASLAIQLPIYAGAIAVLEGAKSKVMAFEKGGLIDKPTMALMGEAGPEIVIPEQGFKDYVKEQIIPFQAQALGVPLSEFTNQNFIQNSVNMNRQEQLTEINTTAIKKMSGEIGLLSKTMNQPQGVTITDGSTIINAEMERGRLN